MKIQFCMECAAKLTKHNDTYYECENGHPHYNNPHAAVGVLLINDNNEVLFAKRAGEPQKDKYDFPGGFVNYDEEPEEAAKRELLEEAALEIHDLQLVHAVINHYTENVTSCDLLYICRKWSGTIVPADDVAALEWHELEFMNTDKFAWKYPGAYERIKQKIVG